MSMSFTVKNKLFPGFDLVLLLTTLVNVFNYFKLNDVINTEKRLVELRLPTKMAFMELTDGVFT